MNLFFQIERDEIDVAMSRFLYSAERCSVGACLESSYLEYYFFSKYPEKVSPTWNLIRFYDEV